MRIAFVHDWNPDFYQEYTWQDGLCAALKELKNRGHEVRLYADVERTIPNIIHTEGIAPLAHLIKGIDREWPEVILCWADFTRQNAEPLAKLGKPMAICFAGGEAISHNTELFDHIFVESQTYEDILKAAGHPVSRAFGANTDLFQPTEQAKIFDTIFPATFALWKRHRIFARATEHLRACAVGYMYDNWESECWKDCVKAGNLVLPHVSPDALNRLYNASHTCLLTSESVGGSQRTILEAMACNIPVLAISDSEKLCEFIRDAEDRGYTVGEIIDAERPIEEYRDVIEAWSKGPTNGREFVQKYWSHIQYADALEKGLNEISSRSRG